MANRAYLQCLEGKSKAEIVVKYSLPGLWCDLFGPADFFTGNECPVKNACKSETSSYLLTPAPKAVERFATRMKRAKFSLDDDNVVALLYAWLKTHFGEGWLFADTTELEWMTDTFVADTRKQLQWAEKHVKRGKISPNTLLFDLGWGTGLSTEEMAEALADARRNPPDLTKLEGRPYRMEDSYEVGQTIAHPLFGSGTVRSVNETKVSILFSVGLKTLVHRKR